MKKIIIVVTALFVLSTGLYPMVWGNGICRTALASGGCGGLVQSAIRGGSSDMSIAELEVLAASSFFQSQQDYKGVLGLVERSKQVSDTKTFENKLTAVNSSIECTIASYQKIFREIETLEKNESISYSLQMFDYKRFCEENELIPSIFEKVEELFKESPESVCWYMIDKMNEIKNQLEDMKTTLKKGLPIEIEKVWKVNQLFNKLDLFGQYVAMVMASI